VDTLILLLGKNADINSKNRSGDTILHRIAMSSSSDSRNLNMINYLIDHGANIDAKNNAGLTPLLLISSRHSELRTIQLLIQRGADVNANDSMGQNILQRFTSGPDPFSRAFFMYSITYGINSKKSVNYLLKNGLDVNSTDHQGYNTLYKILHKYEGSLLSKYLVKRILNSTTNFDLLASNGKTLLHFATETRPGLVQVMLKLGANIKEISKDNRTVLHYAAISGSVKLLKLFLGRGIDITRKSNTGKTALLDAASNGNMKALKFLISKGAKVTATSNDGKNALHYTIIDKKNGHSGNLDVAKFLLTTNINFVAKDVNGKTALDYARIRNDKNIYRLIKKKLTQLKSVIAIQPEKPVI